MKKSLIFSGLLAATPLALLLPGCSGGLSSVSPTATPVSNPTSTPTPTTAAPVTTAFVLGNGQRATLVTQQNGTGLTGTLQIQAPLLNVASTRQSNALNYTFRVGTYQITGTFTPPRGFNITGTDGGQPLFTMTGQFSTTTETGSYTVKVNGQTDTGTIPKIGQTTPTATPTTRPTTTPTTKPSGVVANLTIKPSADSGFVSVPITTATLIRTTSINILSAGASGSNSNVDGVAITFPFVDAKAGTVKTINAATVGVSSSLINTRRSFPFYYFAKSGTVTVTALSATTATVTYKDIVFGASEGTSAKGTITVNGTVTGPYITH
ncbi:hypothetical protein EON80_11900 [bacterium]|nr:MAG: hypothetical protein EON80_11900 [bacterium]